MLSESRSKQKWSVNPNGSDWSKDTSKFGSKMLEKMGWTQGKGLGANEDGRTEHVKVRKKTGLRGVGFSSKDAHNWVDHQDDFTSLLADLNDHHGESADITGEVASLEERSKTQKRVHYHKFARGKDLSNYRQNDLDAIFGVRSSKSAPATPADSSDCDSSGGDSTSSCPVVDKRLMISKTKKTKKVQSNQVTSTMSVQEYFARRMATMKDKQKSQDKMESGDGNEEISSTTKDVVDADSNVVSDSDRTQVEKMKKKVKTKSKPIEDEVSSTNNSVENDDRNLSSVDNSGHASTKKKKKAKKKTKDENDVLLAGDATSASLKNSVPDPNLIGSSTDAPIKKKKKAKKRVKMGDDHEFESSSKTMRTD